MRKLGRALIIVIAGVFWTALIVNHFAGNQQPPAPQSKPSDPITTIYKNHFADVTTTTEPNAIGEFPMPQLLDYQPSHTALKIIEALCDLRTHDNTKSYRFIATIDVIYTDGSRGTEDGINVIFYTGSAPNLDCSDVYSVASETWLNIMPDLAGSFFLNDLLK